jgi:sugar lactone lactonase YvrE
MHRNCRRAGLVLLLLLTGFSDSAFTQGPRCASGQVRTVSASYPEAPCFLGDRLCYVEYGANRVTAWDGVRRWKLWEQDKSGPSGLVSLADGTLLVACYDNNTLAHINGEGKTLATVTLDAGAKGPNDFGGDGKGGVYFTTSGTFAKGAPVEGKVYYLPAAAFRIPGKVDQPRLVAENIHYANGLVVTDGGKCLLVAEHLKGRILKFRIREDGGLSGRAVWKRLADVYPDQDEVDWYTGPDGLKVDSHGNLYICQFGAGRLLVTRPDGTCFRTVSLPEKYVTNVALGPKEDSLYITAVNDPWKEPYPGTVYEIPNH